MITLFIRSSVKIFIGIDGCTSPSGFIVKNKCLLYLSGKFCHVLLSRSCRRRENNGNNNTVDRLQMIVRFLIQL